MILDSKGACLEVVKGLNYSSPGDQSLKHSGPLSKFLVIRPLVRFDIYAYKSLTLVADRDVAFMQQFLCNYFARLHRL